MKKQSLGKSLRDLTESQYREVNPKFIKCNNNLQREGRVGRTGLRKDWRKADSENKHRIKIKGPRRKQRRMEPYTDLKWSTVTDRRRDQLFE